MALNKLLSGEAFGMKPSTPSKGTKAKKRPESVSLALKIIYFTLAIGFLDQLLPIFDYFLITFGLRLFMILVLIGVYGAVAFMTYKIGEGKNWARYGFAVLVLLSLVVVFNDDLSAYSTLSFIIIGGRVYALWLLFQKPATDWFNSMKLVKK